MDLGMNDILKNNKDLGHEAWALDRLIRSMLIKKKNYGSDKIESKMIIGLIKMAIRVPNV